MQSMLGAALIHVAGSGKGGRPAHLWLSEGNLNFPGNPCSEAQPCKFSDITEHSSVELVLGLCSLSCLL